MYKDMYQKYSNENFEYSYPFSFNGKGLGYLDSRDQPKYIINYGDPVELVFNIDCQYRAYPIVLTIYNFRYEPIIEIVSNVDQMGNINISLTSEESKQYLKKGIYFVGIKTTNKVSEYTLDDSSLKEEEDEEELIEFTLISPNSYIMQIV